MSEEINLIIRSMKVAKTFPFLRKLKISRKDTILLLNYIDNLQSALEEVREYINNTTYYTNDIKHLKDSLIGEDLLQIIDRNSSEFGTRSSELKENK